MKKLDYIIIVSLIAISLITSGIIVFSYSRIKYESKVIKISVKGKSYKEIPFNDKTKETITVKTELGTNVINISDGYARIAEADCPDKLCVKDGMISKPGQSLVCLPNKVVVEVKGVRDTETDDVAF
jgi:hypothetical protein